MKIVFIFLALFLAFIAVAVIYSTLRGHTKWFWRNSHAEVFVDGHRIPGYVHQSGETVILTRRDTAKPHSYLATLNGQFIFVTDCRDWHAPSFFVFPMGHTNPPCFPDDLIGEGLDNTGPESPAGPAKIAGITLEFHTRDGRLVTVKR